MRYLLRILQAFWDLPRIRLRVRRDLPKEIDALKGAIGGGGEAAGPASGVVLSPAHRLLLEQPARRRLVPLADADHGISQDRLPWAGRPLRFSVVINTVNRADLLERALESLHYQRYPHFEVVVVNGPSTDHTVEVLARWGESIKTASCPVLNLSQSRNVGIAAAAGDVVAFLDDDAVADSYWLEELAAHYDEPTVGAVGGPIYDHTGTAFQCYYTVADRLGRGHPLDRGNPLGNPTGLFNTPGGYYYCTLTGANASARRDLLAALGGFDETFAYFLDETDVCLRIVDAGFRVVLADKAFVHHKYAPSHLRDEKRVQRDFTQIYTSIAYFMHRHGRAFHSAAEIDEALERRLAEHRQHMTWHREAGNLTSEEFSRTIETAREGVQRGRKKGHLEAPYGEFATSSDWNSFSNRDLGARFYPLPADQRLRLVYISDEYGNGPLNGIGRLTVELAEGMVKRGYDVHVVRRTGIPGRKIDFERGVWIHSVPPVFHPEISTPREVPLPQSIVDWAWEAYLEVRRIHAERSVDLVSAPIWDHPGIFCLLDPEILTVITLHTTFKLAAPHKPDWKPTSTYFQNHVAKMIESEGWVLRHAPHLLANSRTVVEEIETAYGLQLSAQRIHTIPHGIGPAPVVQGINFDLPEGAPVALFVGRFEFRKGIDLLLEAIPGVLNTHPDVHFILAGDHSPSIDTVGYLARFRQRHPELANDPRIRIAGLIDDALLQAYFERADVFVCPSRFESFGLVLIEAMRAATPPIAFASTAAKEIIRDGETGFLVGEMSAGSLQGIIGKAVTHPALPKIKRASREAFCDHFGSEKMIDLTTSFYFSCYSGDSRSCSNSPTPYASRDV